MLSVYSEMLGYGTVRLRAASCNSSIWGHSAKDFMEKNDVKVVLALAGTQNFKGVLADDFVISLRSFRVGLSILHMTAASVLLTQFYDETLKMMSTRACSNTCLRRMRTFQLCSR